jgi:hypothetical protein
MALPTLLVLCVLIQATPIMAESVVVDSASGERKKSTVRTSTGTFLPRKHDAVIETIDKRVAAVTMIPVGKDMRRRGKFSCAGWCSC